MAKVKVPVWGTVNKTIFFDPDAGARAEAAVEALAQAISEGIGGTIAHRSLQGLQVGDDHPQYAMWQAPETITGQWNFETIPDIQGETLAEYIQDVVGGDIFDFLQDTTSVVWTYHETADELEANVPPEFVQDTVGLMLTDTASIDLSYNDLAGTLQADVIFANPSGLIGLAAVNGSAGTPLRSDARHAIDQGIAPTWTANHRWTDNDEVQLGTGGDLRLYHDGTNSTIRNDTGSLIVSHAGTTAATLTATEYLFTPTGTVFRSPSAAADAVMSFEADAGFNADFRWRTRSSVNRWLMRKNATAETGANAGSDFDLIARADDGSNIGTALRVTRADLTATFGGRIVGSASTTTRATLNIPHGAAPSSPVNGDMWTTTAGLFVRINGATVGPLT
jgi:hypothetical protein